MDYSHMSTPGGPAAAYYPNALQQIAASQNVFPTQTVSSAAGVPVIPPSLGMYQNAHNGGNDSTAQTPSIPPEMMSAFGFGNIGNGGGLGGDMGMNPTAGGGNTPGEEVAHWNNRIRESVERRGMTLPVVTEPRRGDKVHSAFPRPPPLKRAPFVQQSKPTDNIATKNSGTSINNNGYNIEGDQEKSLLPGLLNSQGLKSSPVSVARGCSSPSPPSGTGQKFACNKCSYFTNRESKLTEHMAAHGGRWICHVCNKAFIKSADLDRHLPIHTKSSTPSKVVTTKEANSSEKKANRASSIAACLAKNKLNESAIATRSNLFNESGDLSDDIDSSLGSPGGKRLHDEEDDSDDVEDEEFSMNRESMPLTQRSEDNSPVDFPVPQNTASTSDMPVFPGFDVGYPQADVIRDTSNTADEMPPLEPPELPQIGDPTANISPRKNASYMRGKRGLNKPRDPTLPIRKPRNFKICTKCNRIKPFTNWDPHELCPRCRTCCRAQACEICMGFSENEWELIEERMARYALKAGPHIPSVRCRYCSYGTRDRVQLQKHYKAHGEAKKICKYCGKAFERPFDLSRHEARHEARLARTGQISLKDVSRKGKSSTSPAAPSTQPDVTSSTSQVVDPSTVTSALGQIDLSGMGFASLDQVTAHGMLPLPLPLVSPEGLIVPNAMKMDPEGRMMSPLLSALQHLPLATLPALTSASLLGALANQQQASATLIPQPTKTPDETSTEETKPFLTAAMRRHKEVKSKIAAFIASKKCYICDVCGTQYRARISLRIHWRHCHRRTAARIDTYSHSVLIETKVVQCEVESESNEINIGYDMPDLAEVIQRRNDIPPVSDINIIKLLLTRSERILSAPSPERGREIEAAVLDMHLDSQRRATPKMSQPQRPPCQASPATVLPDTNDNSIDLTQRSSPLQDSSSSSNLDGNSLLASSLSSLLQASKGAFPNNTPDVSSLMALGTILQASGASGAGALGMTPAGLVPWLASVAQPQPITIEPRETSPTPDMEGPDLVEGPSPTPEFMPVLPVSLTSPQAGRKLSGDICCAQCNYSTNSQTKYEEHLKAHRGRFICKLCSKAFIKITDLTRHWMGHQMKGEYLQCDSCTFKTDNRDVLDEHLRSHYRVNPRPELMLRTLRHIPGAKLFMNNKRLSMRKAVWRLERRRRLEKEPGDASDSPSEDEDGRLLDPVDQTYYNEADEKEEVIPDPYVCVECGGEFATNAELDYHKRKDHPVVQRYSIREDSTSEEEDDFPFSCDHCGKGFYDELKMQRHMRIKHGKRRRSQSGSPRRRSESPRSRGGGSPRRGPGRPRNEPVIPVLQEEPAVETNQPTSTATTSPTAAPIPVAGTPVTSPNKQHRCEFCNKRFTTHAYLIMHRRLHTGEQPFKCDRCDASYAMKQQLLAHQSRNCEPPNKPRTRFYSTSPITITDADSAAYNCPYCKELFSESDALDEHVIAKHNKPECHLCGKTYSNMFYLKDHMRLHTGEMPYKCLCCGRKYAMKGSLFGHLRINRRCKQKHYQLARAANRANQQPGLEAVVTESPDAKAEDSETKEVMSSELDGHATSVTETVSSGTMVTENGGVKHSPDETAKIEDRKEDRKNTSKGSEDSDDTIIEEGVGDTNISPPKQNDVISGLDTAMPAGGVTMEKGLSATEETVKRKRRKPVKFIPDEDMPPVKLKISRMISSPEGAGGGSLPLETPGAQNRQNAYQGSDPSTSVIKTLGNQSVDATTTNFENKSPNRQLFSRGGRGRGRGRGSLRGGLGLASKIKELTEKNLLVGTQGSAEKTTVPTNNQNSTNSSGLDVKRSVDGDIERNTVGENSNDKSNVVDQFTTKTEVIASPADSIGQDMSICRDKNVDSGGFGSTGVELLQFDTTIPPVVPRRGARGRGRGRRRGRGRGRPSTPRGGKTSNLYIVQSTEGAMNDSVLENVAENTSSQENGANVVVVVKGPEKVKYADVNPENKDDDIAQTGDDKAKQEIVPSEGASPDKASVRKTRRSSRQLDGQITPTTPRRSLRRSSGDWAKAPDIGTTLGESSQMSPEDVTGSKPKSRRGRKRKVLLYSEGEAVTVGEGNTMLGGEIGHVTREENSF